MLMVIPFGFRCGTDRFRWQQAGLEGEVSGVGEVVGGDGCEAELSEYEAGDV